MGWKIAACVLGASLVGVVVWVVRFLLDIGDGFGEAFGYPTKRNRRRR